MVTGRHVRAQLSRVLVSNDAMCLGISSVRRVRAVETTRDFTRNSKICDSSGSFRWLPLQLF